MTKTKQANYPIHADVLNSEAVARVFAEARNSYFLPHAFPEGCPQHPSYGQGHSTVAGACATIVKAGSTIRCSAQFDSRDQHFAAERRRISLVPYTGADGDKLTIGGEMNKLAANIGRRAQSCGRSLAVRLRRFAAAR